MFVKENAIFTLENFEGPLDFLIHLIQKHEIDIYDVTIKKITSHFVSAKGLEDIDLGADFIAMTATLLLLKSKNLLPREATENQLVEEIEPDPEFNMIHQLVDYCRFKEVAKVLSEKEEQQNTLFTRGCDELGEPMKPLGLEPFSLDDLAKLFQQVLLKAKAHHRSIEEEVWRVADKIIALRDMLQKSQFLEFYRLFDSEKSKEELIVTFLAILELMKLGEAVVIKKDEKLLIAKP